MTEIFPYAQFSIDADHSPSTAFPRSHTLHIPLIDIKLRAGTVTTPSVRVQIDSGAAYCVFGRDMADLLQIKLKAGKLKKDMSGIGGNIDLYFSNVSLLINKITLSCYAGFMDQDFPGQKVYMGLLGGHDFLNKVPVTLNVVNSQILIG